MTDDTETVTFTIEGEAEESTLAVPQGVLELVSEGDESGAESIGDVAMMSLANQVHHLSHHGHGGGGPENLDEIEQATMEAFEDRFGVTFAEATGHDH